MAVFVTLVNFQGHKKIQKFQQEVVFSIELGSHECFAPPPVLIPSLFLFFFYSLLCWFVSVHVFNLHHLGHLFIQQCGCTMVCGDGKSSLNQ